jgi:hypothetical protein
MTAAALEPLKFAAEDELLDAASEFGGGLPSGASRRSPRAPDVEEVEEEESIPDDEKERVAPLPLGPGSLLLRSHRLASRARFARWPWRTSTGGDGRWNEQRTRLRGEARRPSRSMGRNASATGHAGSGSGNPAAGGEPTLSLGEEAIRRLRPYAGPSPPSRKEGAHGSARTLDEPRSGLGGCLGALPGDGLGFGNHDTRSLPNLLPRSTPPIGAFAGLRSEPSGALRERPWAPCPDGSEC